MGCYKTSCSNAGRLSNSADELTKFRKLWWNQGNIHPKPKSIEINSNLEVNVRVYELPSASHEAGCSTIMWLLIGAVVHVLGTNADFFLGAHSCIRINYSYLIVGKVKLGDYNGYKINRLEAGPNWEGEKGTKMIRECWTYYAKTIKDIYVSCSKSRHRGESQSAKSFRVEMYLWLKNKTKEADGSIRPEGRP
ncbi:1181_t:CDS:2, partial [Ambispora gerdemannii]